METIDKKEIGRLLNGKEILKEKEAKLYSELQKVYDGVDKAFKHQNRNEDNFFLSLVNEYVVFVVWCMGFVDLYDSYSIFDRNHREVGIGGKITVRDFYVGDTECYVAEIESKGVTKDKKGNINVLDLDLSTAILVARACHHTFYAEFFI